MRRQMEREETFFFVIIIINFPENKTAKREFFQINEKMLLISPERNKNTIYLELCMSRKTYKTENNKKESIHKI